MFGGKLMRQSRPAVNGSSTMAVVGLIGFGPAALATGWLHGAAVGVMIPSVAMHGTVPQVIGVAVTGSPVSAITASDSR